MQFCDNKIVIKIAKIDFIGFHFLHVAQRWLSKLDAARTRARIELITLMVDGDMRAASRELPCYE
jgi:hypothetical protein